MAYYQLYAVYNKVYSAHVPNVFLQLQEKGYFMGSCKKKTEKLMNEAETRLLKRG